MSLNRNEWKVLSSVSILHALVHMHMLIFAAVNLRMVDSYGSGIAEIGLIGTIGFFLFGFGALPAGFFIDRFGARTVLAVCCGGILVADIIMLFSSSIIILSLGLALLGLSASLYHPAGLGLISRTIKERGYAMGIHGLVGNFGVAFGPMIAGLIASQGDWRFAYAWPVVLMLALTLFFLFSRFHDPGREKQSASSSSVKPTFARNLMIIMLLVISLQAVSGFIYRGSNTFMPAYMGSALESILPDMEITARGGVLTALVLISGAAGQFLAGSLTRKYSEERLQLVFTVLVAPLLILTGLLEGVAMLFAAMAFAFVFYGLQPLGNTLVAKYSPEVFRGRSFGLSFFLSFGLGAFGSAFAGYIGENSGFATVYSTLGVIATGSILIALLVFFLSRKKRQFIESG